ncbi:hypothetical protein [uncultured Rubinisphaera sp.]|uniref:hypothetical protein n=1 Tax=uncultured Rubinisphaera sp. TaxID=1678686 RepID=UPI0030DD6684|tara:strand:- start:1555 stop:1986 length:432 start_codon:yes stop_codon:yes gene_type:complete
MACEITFKDRFVQLNNMQFNRLIDFAIEIAEVSATTTETEFVERMKNRNEGFFWPGRGIEIEEDFPEIVERKFWSRVFFDLSRAIFDRTTGIHTHSFWQSQSIHQAHGTGLLFEYAVRDAEPRWSADTIDRREFDEVVNRRKR